VLRICDAIYGEALRFWRNIRRAADYRRNVRRRRRRPLCAI